MARSLVLMLTPGQRAELEKARDTHPRPYIRERRAALLKVAEGASGRAVALPNLRRRQPTPPGRIPSRNSGED
jgi:hypothetical protein